MYNQELQHFADNYSLIDYDKIKFDWNGKHGENFVDNNLVFRQELSE